MNKNRFRMLLTISMFYLFISGFGLWCVFKEPEQFSKWERRPLADKVTLSMDSFIAGDFMEQAEKYLTDQFPLRDELRQLKVQLQAKVLRQKDVGDYYMVNGSLSKLDKVMDEASVRYACQKINKLYETYLKPYNSRAFFCVVPDKNYYLAADNGYPSLDYKALYDFVGNELLMDEISVVDLLSGEDYYLTDSHWRQEKIVDVAERIRQAFGVTDKNVYETVYAGEFLGVYGGQSALSFEKEALNYLTNEELKACRVYNHETRKTTPVYDLAAFQNVDPYDIFLSGAVPLLEITNPAGDPKKELLVFRDSFGSSLVPLLVHGYGKVTVIDTRYISPEILPQYVQFRGQDTLFVYSTMLFNNSVSLR